MHGVTTKISGKAYLKYMHFQFFFKLFMILKSRENNRVNAPEVFHFAEVS